MKWSEKRQQDDRFKSNDVIKYIKCVRSNTTIKRQRLSYREQGRSKYPTTTCCLQETHFTFKDMDKLKGGKIYSMQTVIKSKLE